MKKLLQAIGPAIIVAAVVLGPGSILTSSKVGASVGLMGIPVVVMASILMIAMVALAARLGVVYNDSLCDELARRLGRPVAIAIGLTLFTLVALFQSSNNLALVGGIEPLLGDAAMSFGGKAAVLLIVNVLVISSLYLLRDLYKSVERLMKLLVGMMALAFLVNAAVAFSSPRDYTPVAASTAEFDWLPMLAMIGTTFSVAGAFYQAYLVKEKGWGLADVRRGTFDSILSISLLGLVTSLILLTSWRVFYGRPEPVELSSVADVARQLQPLFGPFAKTIFCTGILAGALSSFLVNALIGGTVLSDSLNRGSRMQDGWPVHLTAAGLLIGMLVALAAFAREGSTVLLITFAQSLTVLGVPALAFALLYLGTRPELSGDRRIPTALILLAALGLVTSLLLAGLTASTVWSKWFAAA